jgi:hypothetical protein
MQAFLRFFPKNQRVEQRGWIFRGEIGGNGNKKEPDIHPALTIS